jgi:cysteine desulfurase/selenocysteine lyase
VLFTPGTTFGINLVANGFTSILKPGDEVLISAMEHRNIVPWQMLCERTGAVLKVIPMNQEGN